MVSLSMLWTVSVLLFSSFSFAFPSLFRRATISPDGTCGPSKGYTCQGSNFGNSCGKYNLCGRDPSYSKLSSGCQPAYGFCYAQGSVSPDGSCGGSDMFICLGSSFGNSCGPNNLCGRDAGYSGNGCQPQYGYCAQCTTTVPPSTSTITSRTTTTLPVTAHGSTTVTVTSGISSITTTTTTTSVSTTVSTAITTSTVTPTPVTTTTTVGAITTISSGTVTVNYVSGVVFNKRDTTAASTVLPALPLKVAAITSTPSSNTTTAAVRLLARATGAAPLSCGTVVSTGFTTTTTTTTTTLTAFSTTTTISSSYTTVPSSTTTFKSTSTSITTTTSTTTSTVLETPPAATITATATSVSTTIVPAATATVGLPGPVYSKAYERTDTNTCFDSGPYYQQVGASYDTSNNYQVPVTQCAAACSSQTQCRSFYFSHSTDPSGNAGSYCLLDLNPAASSDVTCNYQTTTTYLVAYNKVQ